MGMMKASRVSSINPRVVLGSSCTIFLFFSLLFFEFQDDPKNKTKNIPVNMTATSMEIIYYYI